MNKEYIKEIPNWEKTFLNDMKDSLSKQQIELLNGRYIRAYEGMIYGEMYAEWKEKRIKQTLNA